MKFVKALFVTFAVFVSIILTRPVVGAQADLEAFAYDSWTTSLTEEVEMTEEDLHASLGEPDSVEAVEVEDHLEMQLFTRSSDAVDLEVEAIINTETAVVASLNFDLIYSDVTYSDAPAFEAAFDLVTEEALELYANQTLLSKNELIDLLGEPTRIQLSGPYELLHYTVAGSDDADAEYVAFTLDDAVYSLNSHLNDPALSAEPFDVTISEMNQLSHTAGVTYNDMRTRFGKPQSVYYDFTTQIISYFWYSDVDETIETINYITDFRGIMLEVSYR